MFPSRHLRHLRCYLARFFRAFLTVGALAPPAGAASLSISFKRVRSQGPGDRGAVKFPILNWHAEVHCRHSRGTAKEAA
jgi:hypothetical protein